MAALVFAILSAVSFLLALLSLPGLDWVTLGLLLLAVAVVCGNLPARVSRT